MIRTLLIAAALLLAAAEPVAAQGSIRPGETVRGELTPADPTLDDGSYYDAWRFQAQAGHVYEVRMESGDFDAYLAVGSAAGDDCDDCEADDDGAGGTDALVRFRAPAAGTYTISANALSEGETGVYTLSLADLGESPEDLEGPTSSFEITELSAVGRAGIRAGATVQASLTEDDAIDADASYYDLYTYQGRAGETITISLSSEDYDTYLSIGTEVDGEYHELDGNDDGEDGTDSELTITLPHTGEYLIRATSLFGGDTGEYTLRVTRN